MEKKRCCQVSGNWMTMRADPSGAPSPCVATVPCTAQCAGTLPAAGVGVACVTLTLATCNAFNASTVQAGAAEADDAAPASNNTVSAAAVFIVAACILPVPPDCWRGQPR
jgi:hypothetical protein